MRDWYARIVLFLIRPALARRGDGATCRTRFRTDSPEQDSENPVLCPADIQTPRLDHIGMEWQGKSLRVVLRPCAAPLDHADLDPLR
jgi:hypothetical protein